MPRLASGQDKQTSDIRTLRLIFGEKLVFSIVLEVTMF